MKVGAAKIAPTFSNSAFCLFCLPDRRKSELLEVGVLQYVSRVLRVRLVNSRGPGIYMVRGC